MWQSQLHIQACRVLSQYQSHWQLSQGPVELPGGAVELGAALEGLAELAAEDWLELLCWQQWQST